MRVFFFSPCDGNARLSFRRTHSINHPLEFSLREMENFFHAMNRDERRTFARSWNYSSLYPPTRLKREQKRMKIRGRILGSNSPFFSTARYFNALIAAVRLSPPSPRGRGEVSTRFEARRYREISRLVVTRPGNELLVIVVVERKGGPVLLVENWLPSGGVKNHRRQG